MQILKHRISTLNGTDEIFELPNEYVSTSIDVLEINKNTKETGYRDYTEIGNKFIQISPAPSSDHFLLIFYGINDSLSLTSFDRKRVSELLELIDRHDTELTKLTEAVTKRLSRQEFSQWARAIESKLKHIPS